MSDQGQEILAMIKKLLVVVPTTLILAIAVFWAVVRIQYHVQTERLTSTAVSGINPEMTLDEAQALLSARSFHRIVDSPEFLFTTPRASLLTTTTYYIGALGLNQAGFVVRLEHKDDLVRSVAAERLRFKKSP